MKFKQSEVNASKAQALAQIKTFLEADDVDGQFATRNGGYYSSDKFLVTWLGNYKGIPSEFSIDICDSFYKQYSGYKAIYVTRSLLHEKQLGGYSSIERALLEVGLKLCGVAEKKEFFDKYATKYNEKLKKLNNH